LAHASGYELRLISLATATAVAPPRDLAVVIGARAILTVAGPNEIKLVYDTASGYAWGNGGPVLETLSRMATTADINLK
jgi:hypothetical protein